MKERVLRVGKPTPLVGVISEPDELDADRPALLILNSGVMHHVGACRMSVRLARAVAAKGLLAARFDYSGIGDSEPRRGTAAFEESSIAETREVMDYLEKTRGINRFILFGLCSGADAAYFTALKDERVVGTIQLDGFCYRTWQYPLRYYIPLLLKGERWKSFLSKRLQRLRGTPEKPLTPGALAGVDDAYFEVPSYIRRFPPRDTVAEGLRKLTGRGVKMLNIFTSGEPEIIYQAQYRQSFRDVPFGDRLQVSYYPGANHIITQREYQVSVLGEIVDWVLAVDREPRSISRAA